MKENCYAQAADESVMSHLFEGHQGRTGDGGIARTVPIFKLPIDTELVQVVKVLT